MIEVKSLTKRYGDNLALDDLTFTLEDGLIYGFLGPNGAGKSTTMNIITGYIAPTSGQVTINGHSIIDEPREAKRHIGYLPEVPPLYGDMTVSEYLSFAAELKGIPKKQRAAEIERVMDTAKLEEVGDRLIANLSKGFRQRVGLAQAVMGMPDIIILDEPTVGLDPKQIIEIRDLIRGLAGEHTVILSSHILSEIQELCDKIIIIHQGRLIADGTPAELEQRLGESSMEITVKSGDADFAAGLVSNIEGIESVAVVESTDSETTLHLKLARDADVRENIFAACVSAGCPLLMMKSTDFSLEHAFLELTKERRLVRRKKRKTEPEQREIGSDNSEKEVDRQ